ncbi:MAG: rod shape-determining protein MreC [Deltaproteobacteria bacterium]|nr:rod shape-determining protein MreC [Deltaproteobacteria bacterium]
MLDWLRKFRKIIIMVLLLLSALLFYSINLRDREKTTLFEKVVLEISAPFEMAFEYSVRSIRDWWTHYVWLVSTAERNRELEEENRQLRSDLLQIDEIRQSNERLRKLLDFREETSLPALPARVIAEDSTNWFHSIVIDKGSKDGIREGMPVVAAEGVVGRIIRSSPHVARVLLITDASSAVASLSQNNRARGVCRGQGGFLTLEFTLRQKEIKVGDRIVTSGTGGVFPKGVPLGNVVRIGRKSYGLFQSVTLVPAVDFFSLEEVLVLRREEE